MGSYKETQSYKEISAGWAWIREMDADAAEAAQRWADEHKEEMKQLDRILYYSEQKYNKLFVSDDVEGAELKLPVSLDTEQFLPEAVRDRLYNDKRWFERARYMPEETDAEEALYLQKEVADALHELTELQREVLFRNVINRESTESIARDKNCSARNIRDIRGRALKFLRSKVSDRHGNLPMPLLLAVLIIAVIALPVYFFVEQIGDAYAWVGYLLAAVCAALGGLALWIRRHSGTMNLLRWHWGKLNGVRKK